jgi:hypothetical protein
MHELQTLDTFTDKLKGILTPEQTARYLIQVEKVSIFKLGESPRFLFTLILSLVQTQVNHQYFQSLGLTQAELQRKWRQ